MTKKQAGQAPAKKGPAKKKSAPRKKTAPIPGLEEATRQLEKLMASGDLITQSDLQALLTSLHGPSAQDGLSDAEADAKDKAQELAWDAMEAGTEAQARKLAKRALALDPDCVDALALLAEIESDSPRKLIEALQKAVTAGERSLGAKFIQENKGHFWGLIETRPYMRAVAQLAGALKDVGLNADAIRHYARMLELNPDDNQGVRDPLLGLYLATDDLDGARNLLKEYEEDGSANFAWARVLERYLANDMARATVELHIARKANRFVELYLSGHGEIPKELPEMYSPGSKEEAILLMDNLSYAWAEHKEAGLWLAEQLAKQPVSRPAPKKASAKPPMGLQ